MRKKTNEMIEDEKGERRNRRGMESKGELYEGTLCKGVYCIRKERAIRGRRKWKMKLKKRV